MPQTLLLSELQEEYLALQECQQLLEYLEALNLGSAHRLILQVRLRLTWLQLRNPVHQSQDELLTQLRRLSRCLGTRRHDQILSPDERRSLG